MALVETVQESLIEKWTHKKVANHLLDSKIFNKLGSNDIFSLNPQTLHFPGYEVGKTLSKTFEIVNKSDVMQKLHIIPPQSPFFKIDYTKKERFAPGCTLRCRVSFTPTEWRYYYDCIRLHCPEEENLIIPLHAFPVADYSEFPSVLSFQNISIGDSATKSIPVRSKVPVEFQFSIKLLQPSQSVSISPLTGVIPQNGETVIKITYSPTRFATESLHFKLDIAQFDSPNLVCLVTGSCSSKVAPLKIDNMDKTSKKVIRLDPVNVSPLARARLRQSLKMPNNTVEAPSTFEAFTVEAQLPTEGIETALIENADFWTSHTLVSRILLNDPNKMKIKDLKKALSTKTTEENRQTKAAKFEAELRNADYKERQNQLIWQTTLGSEPLQESTKLKIHKERKTAWRRYQSRRGEVANVSKYDDGSSTSMAIRVTFRRTYRLFDVSPLSVYGTPTFDPFQNDFWRLKLERLELLQQASRAVLIRNRSDKKIEGLKRLKEAFESGKADVEADDFVETNNSSKVAVAFISECPKITRKKYASELPIDVKENITDIDIVPMMYLTSADAAFERKPLYHSIKVTRQFQLLGFSQVNISNLSYAPRMPTGRNYRSGAEDELTIASTTAKAPKSREDLFEDEGTETVEQRNNIVHLEVPSFMSAKTNFSTSRYMGNDLITFSLPLPYSEADHDVQFCPLARYPNVPGGRKPLANVLHDRDVIKGIMNWRNLPAAGPQATATLPCSAKLMSLHFADSVEPLDLLPPPPAFIRQAPGDFDGETEMEIPVGQISTLTPEMIAGKFELMKTSIAKPLIERSAASTKHRKIPDLSKTREAAKKPDRETTLNEATVVSSKVNQNKQLKK